MFSFVRALTAVALLRSISKTARVAALSDRNRLGLKSDPVLGQFRPDLANPFRTDADQAGHEAGLVPLGQELGDPSLLRRQRVEPGREVDPEGRLVRRRGSVVLGQPLTPGVAHFARPLTNLAVEADEPQAE